MSILFKTISFQPKLIPEILAGRKTSTIRYIPEMKDQVNPGDTVFLIDSFQKRPFALAEISSIEKKAFNEFTEEDFSGSDIPNAFEDFKEMIQHFYPQLDITEDTTWGVIRYVIFDDGQDRRLLDLLMQQPDDEEKQEDQSDENNK